MPITLRNIMAMILSFTLIVSLSLPAGSAWAATPLVPDVALDKAIKKQLKKSSGNLSKTDLAKLTTLTATSQNIKSLRGLEFATNLTELNLADNLISDLNPLRNLKKLTSIDLEYNEIATVCPVVGNWTTIEYLKLSDNYIDDIGCFSKLYNLEEIMLSDNLITDISPLKSFAGTYMEITDNDIQDISVAENWEFIEEFYLANNPIQPKDLPLIYELRKYGVYVDTENAYDIQVYIGDERINFKVPPYQTAGTTLVEFRPIFEKLGMAIKYDGKTKTITGTKSGVQVVLKIGNKQATVNGKAKTLNIAPLIRGNVTMVPLRFVAETSGMAVSWNDFNRTIFIGTEEQQLLKVLDRSYYHANTFNVPAYMSMYSEKHPKYDQMEDIWYQFFELMDAQGNNFYGKINSYEVTAVASKQATMLVNTTLEVTNATSGEIVPALTRTTTSEVVFEKNAGGRWQILSETEIKE